MLLPFSTVLFSHVLVALLGCHYGLVAERSAAGVGSATSGAVGAVGTATVLHQRIGDQLHDQRKGDQLQVTSAPLLFKQIIQRRLIGQ